MTSTLTKNDTTTLPQIGDVVDADKLADDIISSSASKDKNTLLAAKGGASSKFNTQPRAWSYGGRVD